MKSHSQPRGTTSGAGDRKDGSGPMPYMSESQTQAYLMARDVIRRIQRTSSLVNALSIDPSRTSRHSDGRRLSH